MRPTPELHVCDIGAWYRRRMPCAAPPGLWKRDQLVGGVDALGNGMLDRLLLHTAVVVPLDACHLYPRLLSGLPQSSGICMSHQGGMEVVDRRAGR